MANELRATAQRVQDILKSFNIEAKVIEFTSLTRTSQEAACTIGCEDGQIAKTLIFKGKNTGKPLCVVASGKNRVDEKKIESLIGEPVEKPDADFVLLHTGFSIGGIPPVGYALAYPMLIDEDLSAYSEIWAAAGTPFAVFCLTLKDLIKITQGKLVDLKKR
jgi:prolyl-tRNA editing enzyme YbaK/EbsC (Cys-tRNA(Pro) deacylase)